MVSGNWSNPLTIILLNVFILGLGNSLRIKRKTEETRWSEQIQLLRPYDKLHSIEFLKIGVGYQVVANAGKELLVCEIDDSFKNSFLIKLHDWISSIKLYDDGTLGVVTGHNIALHLLLDFNKKSAKILEKKTCADNPTLYCSHIEGHSWKDSLFLAGKFFNIFQENKSKFMLL